MNESSANPHARQFLRARSAVLNAMGVSAPKSSDDHGPRFAYLLGLAIHEHRMTDFLAEPRMLTGLVAAGMEHLVWQIAELLSEEPLKRAAALALLAHPGDRENPHKDDGEIEAGLKLFLPRNASTAEAAAPYLVLIAESHGHRWPERWQTCLQRLQPYPRARDSLLLAFAANAWQREGPSSMNFWTYFDQVHDRPRAVQALGPWCAAADPTLVLTALMLHVPGHDADFWLPALCALERLAGQDPARAREFWQHLILGRPFLESPETVQAAPSLWACLPESQVLKALQQPMSRIVARIAAAERSGTPDPDLLRGIASVPDTRVVIHWILRALPLLGAAQGRHFERVARLLRYVQYDASPPDLARFLNAAGSLRPEKLDHYLDDLVMTPRQPADLPQMIAHFKSPALRSALRRIPEMIVFSCRERCPPDQVRFSLLLALISRACIVLASVDPLSLAEDHLGSDMVAELRYRVALDLWERGAGDLAASIASSIGPEHLRARALLRIDPRRIPEAVDGDFFGLYRLLTDPYLLVGEHLRLMALLCKPRFPDLVHKRFLHRLGKTGRSGATMVELTMAAVTYESEVFADAKDLDAAALVFDPSTLVGLSETELCPLIPQIAALGARLPDGHWEVTEAVLGLFALKQVPLADRLEAYDQLITEAFGQWPLRLEYRLQLWHALFYLEMGEAKAQKSLRRMWHWLVPPLLAVMGPKARQQFRRSHRPRWLTAVQQRIFDWIDDQETCIARAEALLTATRSPPFMEIRALCWQLLATRPDLVRALLDLTPAGTERDGLVVALACSGLGELKRAEKWLIQPQAKLRLEAKMLIRALNRKETGKMAISWVTKLADLVAKGAPSLPLWVFQSIYSLEQDSCPVLAKKAHETLQRQGAEGGLVILRLWLAGYYAPRPDKPKLVSENDPEKESAVRAALLQIGIYPYPDRLPDTIPTETGQVAMTTETDATERCKQRELPNWRFEEEPEKMGVVLASFYGLFMPLYWVFWNLAFDLPLPPPHLLVTPVVMVAATAWITLRWLLGNARLHAVVPRFYRLPVTLRWLLRAMAGIPILGFFVPSMALVVLAKEAEEKTCVRSDSFVPLLPVSRLSGRIKRCAMTDWSAALLLIGDILFLLGMYPAEKAAPLPPATVWLLFIFATAVQTGFAVMVARYIIKNGRRAHKSTREIRVWKAFAYVWLLPIPVAPLMVVFALLFTDLRDVAQATFGRMLREAKPAAGEMAPQKLPAQSLTDFFSFKISALAFEVATFAWLGLYLAEPGKGMLQRLEAIIDQVTLIALVLMVTGVLIIIITACGRLGFLAPLDDRTSFGRYLAASQAALICGLCAAWTFYTGDMDYLASIAIIVGCGGAVIKTLGLRDHPRRWGSEMMWAIGFITIASVGWIYFLKPHSPELATIMGVIIIFTPIIPFAAVFGNRKRRPVLMRAFFGEENPQPALSPTMHRLAKGMERCAVWPLTGILAPYWALLIDRRNRQIRRYAMHE